MPNLNDRGRRALRLADHLQKAMEQWLSYRGVSQSCTVSPFVDPTGQPTVILTINAHVACVMIDSLNEQHARSTEQLSPESTPGYSPPDLTRP